jgi:RHS repeat-associated protein
VATSALVAILVLWPGVASADHPWLLGSTLGRSPAQALSADRPALAVSSGGGVLGASPSTGPMAFQPLTEEKINCEVGGIRAPYFTYSGELMTLPFEGYTTCTKPLSQSGEAFLETAGGTVVARGAPYNETAASVSSKGVGTGLRPGNYVIVYTETIISPSGWENKVPFCTASGEVLSCTNASAFPLRPPVSTPTERLGSSNPASKLQYPCTGDPINCATGNLTATQTDVSVGGQGPGLRMVRSYNSLAAAEAKEAGPLGYGWTGTHSAHLELNTSAQTATVFQDNGSGVVFILNTTTNAYTAAPWVQATLKPEGSSYIYTLPNQIKLEFNSEGRITKETDRNGNTVTLAYNSAKELEVVTDGAGRKLTFKYTGGGQVESVTDPMGHAVKYAYESGNLVSVKLPGQETARWKFEYNAARLMTKLTDGRGNSTTNEYDSSHRLSWQLDPMTRKRELKYATLESGTETKIAEPNGSETVEKFNTAGLPTTITRAAGTMSAATTEYGYDSSDDLSAVTDPNKHVTKYTYDGEGNRNSETDPLGHETKWEYNSTHDVISASTPNKETTTIKRDSHGNVEAIERPAPGGHTQATHYKYNRSNGELESMTVLLEPGERTWTYGYDNAGDKTSETDPEQDKRTWAYNEDSQEISTVSPRGNASGAEPAKYTTTIERDAQGRPLRRNEPLSASFAHTVEVPWGEPNAVATDPKGNIWVADNAHNRILGFEGKEDKYVMQFGEEGTGQKQFKGIGGIATNAAGDLFVSDSGNGRVEEFSPTGEYIATFGSPNAGEGQLLSPGPVAIDESGNLWVSNTFGPAEHRFVEFSTSSGKEEKHFGSWGTGVGQSLYVFGITFSGGNLYAAEYSNNRVQEFSTSGESIARFDENGRPRGIATDPTTKNLYVTEWTANRVQEFEPSGKSITTFGSSGSGNGQFSEPQGVAVNSSGTVYVADKGNKRIEEWVGKKAPEPPTFNANLTHTVEVPWGEPNAVATDPKGNIWVADNAHNRILGFEGKEDKYVMQFGEEGTGQKQFKGIGGIATNAAGDLFVSDSGNGRVEEFSPTGEYIATFGSPNAGEGQLLSPGPVAIDESGNLWVSNTFGPAEHRFVEFSTSSGKEEKHFGSWGTGVGQSLYVFGITFSGGNLYAAEYSNNRVQEFSTSGESIARFDENGRPRGIATDPTTKNLYVTEWTANRVQEFEPSGKSITTFGSSGSGNGQFSEPQGVAVNSSGTVYVADKGNKRIEEWVGTLARVTKYTYDANGNLKTITDANGHTTEYTYDADNEPEKVKEPTGTLTETGYDGAGRVISQTDGNGHTTKYERNVLEEVYEVIDPLKRATNKEYDQAGNLEKVIDAANPRRTTTYKYDAANHLEEVTYSDGKTPTVKYVYDADGNRTKMEDGTGTSKYVYDQLDRLDESENGHKQVVKYGYDLANEQTTIIYPNGKEVVREYDNAGRLRKVTDWLGNATVFSYDPDSNLTTTTFPTGTGNVDRYGYTNPDQMSEVKMLKGAETLASLAYARDGDGQLKTTTSKGLPGEETTAYVYDENNRLTKAGTVAYKYDAADNVKEIGSSTYTYDEADELKEGTNVKYEYDRLGERTKTKPSGEEETTYEYDQAGNLTKVTKPPKLNHITNWTYANNGDGLRMSELTSGSNVSGLTNYLAWDSSANLPLLLNVGNTGFVYGPGGLAIEEIYASEVTYMHHDQQGSTRLLTGSAGAIAGKATYDAYGNRTGVTGEEAVLGYEGQYTDLSGLIYLRARTYDLTTAQFLRRDPLVMATRQPYAYAGDNPVNRADPTGLGEWEVELPCVWPFCGPPPSAIEGVEQIGRGVIEGAETSWHGVEGAWNAVFSSGGCGEIPRGAIDAEDALKDIARKTPGISRGELGKRLERAKKAAGVPPGDNTKIDPDTGEIYDEKTGEHIGNVFD